MTDMLIATHDQALHAIREHVDQPDFDPVLRAVVVGVIGCHPSLPGMSRDPDPECGFCAGAGSGFVPETGQREHCHCRCPWCLGCEEALCGGPCPSVAAVGEGLGLLASSDLSKEEGPTP